MCRGAAGGGAIGPNSERYAWRFAPMLSRVLARQRKLVSREPALTTARLVQCVVIGLVVGGLWFQLEVTARNARCARAFISVRCYRATSCEARAVSARSRTFS